MSFDPKMFELPPDILAVKRVSPAKLKKLEKRSKHFVMVPWEWMDKLVGCRGQTLRVAFVILYLSWKARGTPIKLANGMLLMDGVSRRAKWRALDHLEEVGLISVERRLRKSPIITVL
jgi:hypothetical protein